MASAPGSLVELYFSAYLSVSCKKENRVVEMFVEIIKNMYGISLAEFAVMIVDTFTYLIALFIVLFAFVKLDKVTKKSACQRS